MIIEMREIIIRNKVYWVMDNEGQRHLYHDSLAAQMFEERMARERKENGQNVDVHA